MTTTPKGPWQQAHPTLTECTRHNGLCAYRQGDPDRCDVCHAPWDAITRTWQDATTRDEHEAQHTRDDAAEARKAIGRANWRARRASQEAAPTHEGTLG